MLFELFKKELQDAGQPYDIIDLNWRNYGNILVAYLTIIFKIIVNVPKYKYISFHGTANEFMYLASLTVMMGNMFSKKVILRKFAGSFIKIYEDSNFIQKALIRYGLQKADTVFFETKYLVEYFKKFNSRTYWFPNVRTKQTKRTDGNFQYRFVFLGHVKRAKGIDQILEASNSLDEKYQIDIYGPISDEYDEAYFKNYNVTYRGSLKPDEIVDALVQYDVLLLPTFWKGEGYPGVILEAFSVGLPVIATDLDGIKEIVEDGSGILVAKQNAHQVLEAMKTFNEDNYKEFSANALKRFDAFDSKICTATFFDIVRGLN